MTIHEVLQDHDAAIAKAAAATRAARKVDLTLLIDSMPVTTYNCTEAIRCYQCSSDMDPKNMDLCGAYSKFDKEKNVPIECNSEESHMPGTFCVKYTEQSPRGFIWNGRWRQVIRRCASIASTGVTGVCNWGVHENGVFWQECYCSEDSCNAATSLMSFTTLLLTVCGVVFTLFYFK
ncbi:UPAR/Ly6 domain-containing protein crok isoform X1 [Linepithema humile]|uniref:UPAR/Ly6 domain-containing protein crok isoform X1 n=2 Tax=Linepithema humile TaxID=83485 RepID=UPI00351F3B79